MAVRTSAGKIAYREMQDHVILSRRRPQFQPQCLLLDDGRIVRELTDDVAIAVAADRHKTKELSLPGGDVCEESIRITLAGMPPPGTNEIERERRLLVV